MSRVCDVCGKTKNSGNNVTFSHRGIKRTWSPNLRNVRVYDENGTPKRMKVCTRCLRSGKVNRNRPVNPFFVEEESKTEETETAVNEVSDETDTENTEETSLVGDEAVDEVENTQDSAEADEEIEETDSQSSEDEDLVEEPAE